MSEEKLVLERRAYDNKYLHRDFHASIDNAVAYVGDNYGEDAVKEYLDSYVNIRFRPDMTLSDLQNYFKEIYEAEEAADRLTAELDGHSLKVSVSSCPGLDYLNAHGGASKWYKMTTVYMYASLARRLGLRFTLHEYDEKTGKTSFTFEKTEKEDAK